VKEEVVMVFVFFFLKDIWEVQNSTQSAPSLFGHSRQAKIYNLLIYSEKYIFNPIPLENRVCFFNFHHIKEHFFVIN